jgi:hypothetical protein
LLAMTMSMDAVSLLGDLVTMLILLLIASYLCAFSASY